MAALSRGSLVSGRMDADTPAMFITGVDERGVAVGIVYIGLSTPEGTFCRRCDFGKRRRDRIQDLASNHAFDVVRRYLTGLPVETWTK